VSQDEETGLHSKTRWFLAVGLTALLLPHSALLANASSDSQPGMVHLQIIVVDSPDQAHRILDRIKAGADFAALAKEKSLDPSASDGGYLGAIADRAHHTFVVSCKEIPGFMEAMVMPFAVRQPQELAGVQRGTLVDFTLVVGKSSSYAEAIREHKFQSGEQEPLQAQRLKILESVTSTGPKVKPLEVGQAVPDFTLIDQNGNPVRFSDLAGKVVALTFVYTRCPLPDYCFRFSNNFGRLQKRFAGRLGKDLVLLSITFDPEHDQPEVLAKYASTWRADPRSWHFLTGPLPEVQRVSKMFAADFWPDMDRFTHTQHTIVIDRTGRVAANIEGIEYTADQLGDLVETMLRRPN
jgi:protein SCO1